MTAARSALKRLERWLPLAILVAGVLAYVNAFSNAFVFDDYHVIVQNPDIGSFLRYRIPTRAAVDFTFRLNYALGGLNVADYHAVNLAIHVLCGLLFYGVVRRTLLLPQSRERWQHGASWFALTCALLWILHPLHTESVTYICQRYESMLGLFVFLSLYALIRSADPHPSRLWAVVCLGAALMGVFVKEVIVCLPLLLLLYDYVFMSRSFKVVFLRRWRMHLALFGTWGVFFFAHLWHAALRLSSDGTAGEAMTSVMGSANRYTYFLTQLKVIVRYIQLSFVPVGQNLVYEWPAAGGPGEVAVHGIVIVALGMFSVYALLRRRALGYLGAWFFLCLGPTSSVFPLVSMIQEHRMYLPLAAVVVAAVAAADSGMRRCMAGETRRKVRCTLAAILVSAASVLLAGLTVARNRDYRTERALWESVVRQSPQSLVGRLGLAISLLNQGDTQQASGLFEAVVDDAPEAAHLQQAYRVTQYAKAHDYLGTMSYRNGAHEVAEGHFREAIRVAPYDLTGRSNLGLALKAQGRVEEAVEQWNRVLQQDPAHQNALHCLASTSWQQKNYRDAVAFFERILDTNPGAHAAALELAGLLATCDDETIRNPLRAIKLAEALRSATADQSIKALDVHAMALAALGRHAEAVALLRRALALGEARGLGGLEPLRTRMKEYEQLCIDGVGGK